MSLSTSRIVLYDSSMCGALLHIYGHFVRHTPVTFDREIPGERDFDRRLSTAHVCLVLLIDGRPSGYAYASRHRAKQAYDTVCESTIYLDPEVHGQGHGRQLYDRLLRVLNSLGYYTVLGGITQPNRASELLHQRLGFVDSIQFSTIGYKEGAWQTVHWWRLDLRDFSGAPEPVLRIEDMSSEELALNLT